MVRKGSTVPLSQVTECEHPRRAARPAQRQPDSPLAHTSGSASRSTGYTALTRHRESAAFYVNIGEGQTQLPGLERDDDGQWHDIRTVLSRSRAKHLAIDRGVPDSGPRHDVWERLRTPPAEPADTADTGLDP